ncbi:MAG: hypothetical protein VW870_10345, partial [Rhodobiaceae bacterium]
MKINIGRAARDTVGNYPTCAWRLAQPIMRVAERRIEPVQTVNSANTGKAVRKCGPASHPGLCIIKIDSRKQAFQSLFEHEGTSMIRRSLNASKFRRACHPDASRHLTG